MRLDVSEARELDGASLILSGQADDEVEVRRLAQFLAKEGPKAASVDTPHDLTQEVAVEER